mmetsp:Transcript_10912/g.26538  ORF Transcript_10912/g.26538 Transcript_10912/m.26538 type:complete len:211 (+) Transcript_10912:45-677(+)
MSFCDKRDVGVAASYTPHLRPFPVFSASESPVNFFSCLSIGHLTPPLLHTNCIVVLFQRHLPRWGWPDGHTTSWAACIQSLTDFSLVRSPQSPLLNSKVSTPICFTTFLITLPTLPLHSKGSDGSVTSNSSSVKTCAASISACFVMLASEHRDIPVAEAFLHLPGQKPFMPQLGFKSGRYDTVRLYSERLKCRFSDVPCLAAAPESLFGL